MIKKNWKMLLITSLAILLPVFAGIVLWNQLPEQIPTHWNMQGEIDGYSSKSFSVFGLPLILLAIHWFTVCVTLADPKKQNHSEKILHLVFWIIPSLSIILSAVTYSTAMGKGVRMELIVSVLLGLLFVAIGNYLPKCKQNYTIGIKLPWTLHSEENWNRTHRLAGWLWVIGGLLIISAGFFNLVWLTLSAPLLMALVPTAYSYILYLKGI
jgi:uncharacterized membrane protein